jgi:hypothetical protein
MSQSEKLMKATGLMELLPSGVLDPIKVISRVLEAQEQPNWQDLFIQQIQQSGQMPEPAPDPKLQEMEMKGKIEQQKAAQNAENQQRQMALKERDSQVQLHMKAQEHSLNMQAKAQEAQLSAAEKVHMQRIFSAEAQATANQKLTQSAEQHQQKLQQMKDTKSVQNKTGNSGGKTSARKK